MSQRGALRRFVVSQLVKGPRLADRMPTFSLIEGFVLLALVQHAGAGRHAANGSLRVL